MIVLENCCWSLSLRTGCIIIAVVYILACLTPGHLAPSFGADMIMTAFVYGACVTTVIACLLFLICGIGMGRIWAVQQFLLWLLLTLFEIFIFGLVILIQGRVFSLLFATIPSLLFNAYAILVVYSFWKSLESEDDEYSRAQ